ncbi:hypothetical protein OIU77_011240 [Salix suchowensis]|uniref:Uncharacterized protein n=1 Tax=Salix suchowensis TaxID=1278906 RepID=A0ABQ9ACB5_9ROSI|nr:hypothetical protein OIU77_011240 [Salix suchowensis]
MKGVLDVCPFAINDPKWCCRSPLLRLYLSEIETQFKGDSSAQRCCSCIQDRKQHKDCKYIHPFPECAHTS